MLRVLWVFTLFVALGWACSPPAVSTGEKNEERVGSKDGGTKESVGKEGVAELREVVKEVSKERVEEPRKEVLSRDVVDGGVKEAPGELTGDKGTVEVASEPVKEGSATENIIPELPSAKWTLPSCTSIKGLPGPAFGWSKDDGKTILSAKVAATGGIRYSYGIIALQPANTLLLQYFDAIYRSTDAGCSWSKIGTVTQTPLRLTRGVGHRAWAWSDNYDGLYRIDGSVVTLLQAPIKHILGLGTDPKNADRVVLGGDQGLMHESVDGGKLWRKKGTAASARTGSPYRVAFDPNDLKHVIYGCVSEGFYVTFDEGKTWTASTGLTQKAEGRANGFNAVISPADSKIVWAMAIDLGYTGGGKSNGKYIYRSVDGGRTFKTVVEHLQTNDVILTNGTHLTPHPTNTDVVYWAFGTCASDYGANIFRYDEKTQKLAIHRHPYPDFDDIAISPAKDDFLYLGIRTNSSPLCPKPPGAP